MISALRRVGGSVQALSKRELEEVASFVSRQTPPSKQKQIATDLKVFAYGLSQQCGDATRLRTTRSTSR